MEFGYDEELVEAGHRAGLSALGRDGLPGPDAITTRFRERYEALLWVPGTWEAIEYPGLVRDLRARAGGARGGAGRGRVRGRPALRGHPRRRRGGDDDRAGGLVPRRRASRGARARLSGVHADGRAEPRRPAAFRFLTKHFPTW